MTHKMKTVLLGRLDTSGVVGTGTVFVMAKGYRADEKVHVTNEDVRM